MVDENGGNSNPTDLELKIIRQVEYYFGDFNLGRDKFLNEEINKNDDGWVTVETLITFNRLKTLSTDIGVIIGALKKSPNNLLEIGENKVRRLAGKPIPNDDEKHREDVINRSVYLKGFPESLTLDELLAYFKDNGFDVEHVQMRYLDKKTFKGSVFVVFKSQESAKEFLIKDGVKYGEDDLIKESRSDYKVRKQAEWTKKKEERKKSKQDKGDDKAAKEPEVAENQKGCVLHVSELPQDTSREDLKDLFRPHGKVAWVDFSKGDKEGWVRFVEPNQAVEVQNKVTNEGLALTIKEQTIKSRVLEGEEEVEFWNKLTKTRFEMKSKKYKAKKGKSGWGRRGGKSNFRERGIKREAENTESSGNNEVSVKRIKEEIKQEPT